jgi:hypothetical protein
VSAASELAHLAPRQGRLALVYSEDLVLSSLERPCLTGAYGACSNVRPAINSEERMTTVDGDECSR